MATYAGASCNWVVRDLGVEGCGGVLVARSASLSCCISSFMAVTTADSPRKL